MSQAAHRSQYFCQDLFLVLCLASWGAPSSVKRWLRGKRRRSREFGALKSHLTPFSGWTQRFSGRCLSYFCVCPCHVPLTMLSPIPTTPAAQAEQLQEQLGQMPECFAQFLLAIFSLSLLFAPKPVSPSCSQLFISASFLLAPGSHCLASPLLAGPASLVPFPPLSPCCLPCLFWT